MGGSGAKATTSSASVPQRPALRALEVIPITEGLERLHVFRDPQGFGRTLALPHAAALVALLMDGRRSLEEIADALFEAAGIRAELSDVASIARKLDNAYLLAGMRFQRYRQRKLAQWLKNPVRPAALAGASYSAEPAELRVELAELMATGEPGPSDGSAGDGRPALSGPLQGLLSPHIDPPRGAAAYAAAYGRLAAACDADLFVIFGTAHEGLPQRIALTRKDFATPLGTARNNRPFVERLACELAGSVAGRAIDAFAGEIAHRGEHSIEFQVLMLQHVLGQRRPWSFVPILVGSLHDLIDEGLAPDETPEFQALLAALRAARQQHAGKVCYISGADLAHLGRRYGDEELLTTGRLARQEADDRQLLAHAARGQANDFFRHVAAQGDCNRICGLAPTYLMLQALGPARGELLHYGQAAAEDHTACVSFAAVAFY